MSDAEVAGHWGSAFVALGSSYSNIKTDDIKHLSQNPWLQDDGGRFTLKDGHVEEPEARADKGIVMKLDNPYSPGYALVVCAGLGEWGTSGAAWFLARHWRALSHRFGRRPFLLIVAVTPGNDQSAHEVLAIGHESRLCRVKRWLRSS